MGTEKTKATVCWIRYGTGNNEAEVWFEAGFLEFVEKRERGISGMVEMTSN